MTADAQLAPTSGLPPTNADTDVVNTGMQSVPPGAERIGDVLVMPVKGESAKFRYLPLGAGLQTNPDGSVQAQVIAAGSTGFLQLTTVWDAPADTLEAVRDVLAGRLGEDPPPPVVLSFAPVSDVTARLMIRSDGEMRLLDERNAASGPPFTTLFNLTLDQNSLVAATAATEGQAGNLEVHYDATLNVPVVHRARLSGDLTGVTDRDTLYRKFENGRALMEMPVQSGAFRDELVDRALELLRLGTVASESDTVIDVELTVDSQMRIQAGTDVAAWFGIGDAPRVVTPTPVLPTPPDGGPDEEPAALTLRLAESDIMADAIAFVDVTAGNVSVQLTPDDPAVDIEDVQAGQTISVATHYLRGGAPLHSDVAVGDGPELELDQTALGIEIVRVDATPLEDAGYDRIRVTLRYLPEDRAARDTETLRFRDTPFKTQTWPIVTRGTPLGDSLTYQFRAESLDPGLSSLRVPETVATGPDITLAPGPANEE